MSHIQDMSKASDAASRDVSVAGLGSSELVLVCQHEDDTLRVAAALGRALRGGDAIGLSGDLGAGKTTFVRGLARGAGVPEEVPVCSPSFTLANVYPGRLTLCHLDLYRLTDESDLESIGYRDYADGSCAVAIEWCDRLPEALPADHLRVNLTVVDEDTRRLEVRATGVRSDKLLAAITACR